VCHGWRRGAREGRRMAGSAAPTPCTFLDVDVDVVVVVDVVADQDGSLPKACCD
jgi:hypothetical protein